MCRKNAPVKSKIKKIESELKKIQRINQDSEPTDDNKVPNYNKENLTRRKKTIQTNCCVLPNTRVDFSKKDKIDGSGWHLVVLAKNFKGYQNLKIVSKSWTEGFYYRPRIDKELLEKYSEGLIVSSACLGGEISRKIDNGEIEEAEKR